MRDRRTGHRLAGLLFALLLQVGAMGDAMARAIGIVFDDSGSMARYIQSPTFGVQLLLSTLDGRDGHDRVFTLRFSELMAAFGRGNQLPVPPQGVTADTVQAWLNGARGPVGRREQIGTEELHQRTINDIAATWPNAQTGTPYEPIEVMLDRLVREARNAEDVHLVILSDGEFNNPPDLDRTRQSFTRYREMLTAKQARLRVDFLLIAPSRPELVQLVERQGVRGLLLEIFNGAADGSAGGRYDITDLGQLQAALKDIIARIWAIDRAQQARLLTVNGNEIGLKTPLSVTRMIAVGTALDPQKPPQLTGRLPSVVETRHLLSQMRQADTQPPLGGQRLRGDTSQLRFQPALPPGQHLVGFDRPVGQDVFLLFETAARVDLTVTRPDGTPARRLGNRFILARGERYQLVARLVDAAGSAGPAPVELAALPHRPEVSAALDTPRGLRTLPLQIEPGQALARGALDAETPGSLTARAQVRLEGFVSPPSNPVGIDIVDGGVAFRQEVTRVEGCGDCAADEMRVTVAGDGQPRGVAEVIVTPTIPFDGQAKLDLSGLPVGFAATESDGSPLPADATLPLVNGRPLRMRVTLADPERAVGGTPLRLRITAQEPLLGAAEVALRLRIVVPEAKLTLTGHTAGDSSLPLPLSGENLTAGGSLMDFALTGALKAPGPGETVLEGASALLWFSPVLVQGYTLQVEPRSGFLCVCFLALGPKDRVVTLRWRHPGGLQEAAATGRFQVTLASAEIAWSCGTLLLLLLLLLWLLLGMITSLNTRRFPRGSLAEIVEGRQLPRHIDLRGRNNTLLRSLLPWRAFRLASPHERTAVEGLVIEARNGGGSILLERTEGDFRVVRLGDSAAEMRMVSPRLERVAVTWNDEIERRQYGKITVRLLRTMVGGPS